MKGSLFSTVLEINKEEITQNHIKMQADSG